MRIGSAAPARSKFPSATIDQANGTKTTRYFATSGALDAGDYSLRSKKAIPEPATNSRYCRNRISCPRAASAGTFLIGHSACLA